MEDALKRNKAGTKMTFFSKEVNASKREKNEMEKKNSSKICSLNRFSPSFPPEFIFRNFRLM